MPRRTRNREPERRSSVWQVGKRQVRVHSLLSKLISNNSEAQLQLPILRAYSEIQPSAHQVTLSRN